MERTELKHGYSRWTKISARMIAIAFFLMAGLFAQNTYAQNSFTVPADVQLNLDLGTGQNVNFVESSEAVDILKQELEGLYSQVSNVNGTTGEADNSLRILFFNRILDESQQTDDVEAAITKSYSYLMARKSAMVVTINTQAIVDRAVSLLSE